ncbi:MAG TPA: hypothetical protein VGF56_05365 [Rhizomicrobium sp.]|jgi:hypothetical protein
MPDCEIRLLAADGSVAEIYVTALADDEAAIAHARSFSARHANVEIRQGMRVVWPRPA